MQGAYESYMRGLSPAERENLMQSLESQKKDADKIQCLKITLLQSALQEVWSNGN